jgi:hypothetical protein
MASGSVGLAPSRATGVRLKRHRQGLVVPGDRGQPVATAFRCADRFVHEASLNRHLAGRNASIRGSWWKADRLHAPHERLARPLNHHRRGRNDASGAVVASSNPARVSDHMLVVPLNRHRAGRTLLDSSDASKVVVGMRESARRWLQPVAHDGPLNRHRVGRSASL